MIDLNGAASGINFATSFTEDSAPVAIVSSTLTLTDIDNPTVFSATVRITNLQDSEAESLSIPSTFSYMAATYSTSTGTLMLIGEATLAQYEQVLRTVTYRNTPQNPGFGDRTITFTVNDGATDSAVATSTVTVFPTNDAPLLDLNGAAPGTNFTTTFTEDGGAVAIVSSSLSLIDLDSPTVNGASVRITNLQNIGAEILTADATGTNIELTYDANAGVLGLRNFDTVANYEKVLRSIQYSNTSQNPTFGDRTIQFNVNDSMANSNQAFATVTVIPINDAPVIDLNGNDTGTGFSTSFTENGGAVAIVSPTLNLTDVDSPSVNIATVRIMNLSDASAEFLAANTAGTNITATYYGDPFGILELRGWDSVANYQQVLRSVTYNNTSANPTGGDRSIQFSVNDSMANSNQGFATVSVIAVNSAPTLTGTPAALTNGTEDTTYTIATTDLLAGFTDIEGNTITIANLTATNGAIVNNGDGNYTFTPAANFNGTVNLSYSVSDGNGGVTSATQSFSLKRVFEKSVGS